MSDVLVLCYHAVSPTWPAPLSITPQRLEEQLARLVKDGYRGATFDQGVHAPPAPKTLVVTFDDAYRSVLTYAKPILDGLGLPGTIFVPTDYPGPGAPMVWPGIDEWQHGEHRDELAPMSWEELRGVADQGWEVGSHTCTHPHLTTLGDADLQRELTASRAECEQRLDRPCRTIAYPYGDVDARVRAAAAQAGYAAGAALSRSLREGDRFAWPRVGIYYGDHRAKFALKMSRPVRRLRARLPADNKS